MITDEPEWYEQLLALALERNPGIWEDLRTSGMTDDSELRLAFLYVAPGEAEADDLAAFLRAETDYEVRPHSQREGRVAGRDWFVAGVTRPAALTLEIVDAWVEWMIAAGAAHGPCAFDGWAGHLAGETPPPPAPE
ncbi:MAG: hypothetical protein QOI73_429 [Solirubrobacteraceae bacterium]|nr:hypothetical protein [Solirubrobacteraceae bacterium]